MEVRLNYDIDYVLYLLRVLDEMVRHEARQARQAGQMGQPGRRVARGQGTRTQELDQGKPGLDRIQRGMTSAGTKNKVSTLVIYTNTGQNHKIP